MEDRNCVETDAIQNQLEELPTQWSLTVFHSRDDSKWLQGNTHLALSHGSAEHLRLMKLRTDGNHFLYPLAFLSGLAVLQGQRQRQCFTSLSAPKVGPKTALYLVCIPHLEIKTSNWQPG